MQPWILPYLGKVSQTCWMVDCAACLSGLFLLSGCPFFMFGCGRKVDISKQKYDNSLGCVSSSSTVDKTWTSCCHPLLKARDTKTWRIKRGAEAGLFIHQSNSYKHRYKHTVFDVLAVSLHPASPGLCGSLHRGLFLTFWQRRAQRGYEGRLSVSLLLSGF